MSKSSPALITPEILKWARESSGYRIETIAEKMKKAVADIRGWETGEKQPTIVQLRKLANYYKRPLAVFYLPELPENIPNFHDYRRIDIDDIFQEPVKLRHQIRFALYRREVALELMNDLGEKPPEFNYKINLNNDPEEVGVYIREAIGVKIDQQLSWSYGYEVLNRWRLAIENLGVLVFQTSGISTQEMRGFSVSNFPLPIIGLNSGDHPHGRVFSLFHELAHLMLHENGICDIYEGPGYQRSQNDENVEVFCNHVAGAALVPPEALLTNDIVSAKTGREGWEDSELASIGSNFGVSREVILRRLLILGKTTPEFYRNKREQFIQEYMQLAQKKNKGGPDVFRKVIAKNGISFINLVLESLYNGIITTNELSHYLDVKVKHLKSIEDEVRERNAKYGVA